MYQNNHMINLKQKMKTQKYLMCLFILLLICSIQNIFINSKKLKIKYRKLRRNYIKLWNQVQENRYNLYLLCKKIKSKILINELI